MPFHGCIWNWSIWAASTQGDLTTESRRRREECKCCTCLCRFPFIFWWMLLMFWRNIHLHSKVIFLYFLSHKTLSYLKLLLDSGQHSFEEKFFCVSLEISIFHVFSNEMLARSLNTSCIGNLIFQIICHVVWFLHLLPINKHVEVVWHKADPEVQLSDPSAAQPRRRLLLMLPEQTAALRLQVLLSRN